MKFLLLFLTIFLSLSNADENIICGEGETKTKNNELCYKNQCLDGNDVETIIKANQICSDKFGRGWRLPFYSETSGTKNLFAKDMNLKDNTFENVYDFIKPERKKGVPPCQNTINNFNTLTLSKTNDNRNIMIKKNGSDNITKLTLIEKGQIRCVKEIK